MNVNTFQAHKTTFFHPLMLFKIPVLVLQHLYNMNFKDFSLKIFYNSEGIKRFGLKIHCFSSKNDPLKMIKMTLHVFLVKFY